MPCRLSRRRHRLGRPRRIVARALRQINLDGQWPRTSGPGLGLSAVTFLPAFVILGALLILTVALAAFVRWRQNRPRPQVSDEVVDTARLGGGECGSDATLLQFSTEMCAQCPSVHRMLSEVAAGVDGVVHLDVDLTHRPDIARHFHVMQTPTTLILNRDGIIQTRFSGSPRRDVVELELARITQSVPSV